MKNTQTGAPPFDLAALSLLELPRGEQRFHKSPAEKQEQIKAKARYDTAAKALYSPLCQKALDKLCKAGCERHFLMTILLRGSSLELKPSTRLYRKAELRDLNKLVNDMRLLAERLSDHRWYELFRILANVSVVGPNGLRQQLRITADEIHFTLTNGRQRLQQLSGLDNFVLVENYVRTMTGKPHFTELAMLLGKVHRNSEISPEKLKVHLRTYYGKARKASEELGKSTPET